MSIAEPTPIRRDTREARIKPRKNAVARLAQRLRARRRAFLGSSAASALAGGAIYRALRLIERTQTPAAGSSDSTAILEAAHPAIVGLWHGQHLLAPLFRPAHLPYVALLSKSADAEINAAVVGRFGIGTVRGSGGRKRKAAHRKGGVAALIALRQHMSEGFGVCMIADVPKGKPREAGLGIVTLARITGRPIVPSAAATSRRHVIAGSWDKTTVPLPFGRLAVVMGAPIFVPRDADAARLEEIRAEVTLAIEAANREAVRLADTRP